MLSKRAILSSMKTPSVHKLLRDKSDSKIWFSKKGSQGETTWLAVAELTILVCSLEVRVHLWLSFQIQAVLTPRTFVAQTFEAGCFTSRSLMLNMFNAKTFDFGDI